MSFTVTSELLEATTSRALKGHRDHAKNMRGDREIQIDAGMLTDEGLQDLLATATAAQDTKTTRAIQSIIAARSGEFGVPVANFKAFSDVLRAFLLEDILDGWVYVEKHDGKLYPELVTSITFDDGYTHRGKGHPTVRIHTASYGYSSDGNYKIKFGVQQPTHSFSPQDVARRRIADILAASGIYKETQALKDAHLSSMERHRRVTQPGFAQQFRVNGAAYCFEEEDYRRRGTQLVNRRVIHDLDSSNYGAYAHSVESSLFEKHPTANGVGEIPEHPVIRVFDLRTHEYLWVNADAMTPYEYDTSLRNKLVLPKSHRDLLDVLTTDLGAFTSDIIEGKSAGNVVLCKGIAGVGKTLTAEVYAELIGRPLYSIHSGNLGTSAKEINENLQRIFQLAKRWDAVLLLDEADIFVMRRGTNLEQNAIVAEFLRTLEYFDGLLFMTTNRPDDIDDAIINRTAAVINYEPPCAPDAAAIWRVMAVQYECELADDLIDGLIDLFPAIAPRDIKMLFRLALRVAKAHKETLTLETFRRCAMFRAVKMKPLEAPAA